MLRKYARTLSLFLILPVIVGLSAGSAFAGAIQLLTTIPVPLANALRAFDISFWDSKTGLLYLGDRSNASVDVFDPSTNQFVRAIQVTPPFAGVAFNPNGTADNNHSGPNGVLVVGGRFLVVTDSGSRVVSIDLANGDALVSDVTTSGSAFRADELAYSPRTNQLLVVNNADTPPFATLITIDPNTGVLTVGATITFSVDNGVDATNGAEQPVWDPQTGKFYLSIPEINCDSPNPPCGGGGPQGGVARIDPNSQGAVDAFFEADLCQPAGLTLGPFDNLLLGCSQPFDTQNNAWSPADPNTAAPVSLIMNAQTGAIVAVVNGISGNDEVWFNGHDGKYYLAARNNPGGPVLGVINGNSNTLEQIVPTINTAGNPNVPFPAGSSHSVAVDANNDHALVALPANNVSPNCLNGCIGVYGEPAE